MIYHIFIMALPRDIPLDKVGGVAYSWRREWSSVSYRRLSVDEVDLTHPRVHLQSLLRSQTQAELAASIGVCRTYLIDVLKGRRNPGPKVLSFLGRKKIEIYPIEAKNS